MLSRHLKLFQVRKCEEKQKTRLIRQDLTIRKRRGLQVMRSMSHSLATPFSLGKPSIHSTQSPMNRTYPLCQPFSLLLRTR
jgi:hypothetical protein